MSRRIIHGVEEFHTLVGQEMGVSDWFLLEQSRIDAFAEAIEDRQWIHVDPKRARAEGPYGTTIGHGFLTLSLVSHLVRQVIHVEGNFLSSLNYGLNRVRFPSPVPAGSRIRARALIAAVEEVDGGVQVTWSVIVERENVPKPALVAEWLVRYYGRKGPN